ncbi:MAG: hypothetical protein K2O01_03460 [Bacteroidales bacterium]|nr:hypothetical protein [Bacteroidales bacterium]
MDAIARRTALSRFVSGEPTEKAASEEAAFFCTWNFIPLGFLKKCGFNPFGFDKKRGVIPLGFHEIPDVIFSTGEFYVKNVL